MEHNLAFLFIAPGFEQGRREGTLTRNPCFPVINFASVPNVTRVAQLWNQQKLLESVLSDDGWIVTRYLYEYVFKPTILSTVDFFPSHLLKRWQIKQNWDAVFMQLSPHLCTCPILQWLAWWVSLQIGLKLYLIKVYPKKEIIGSNYITSIRSSVSYHPPL